MLGLIHGPATLFYLVDLLCGTKLFACHRLRSITLHAHLAIDLGDDIAEAMSAAWPQVETLRLSPRRKLWEDDTIKATLRSPNSFTIRCPRLPYGITIRS